MMFVSSVYDNELPNASAAMSCSKSRLSSRTGSLTGHKSQAVRNILISAF